MTLFPFAARPAKLTSPGNPSEQINSRIETRLERTSYLAGALLLE